MRLFLSLFALSMIVIIGIFFSPVRAMCQPSFPEKFLDGQEIYTLEVIENDTGAWYYQILKGEKIYIIQKSIPAISGNKAFVDSLQAHTVGVLVMDKMAKGFFPPRISKQELDSLQIIM